jgi:hypothetical protein
MHAMMPQAFLLRFGAVIMRGLHANREMSLWVSQRKNRQRSGAWICASSVHFMLGVEFARQNQVQISCMVIHGSNLYNLYYSTFSRRIPHEIGLFRERPLLRYLLLSILRSPLSWPLVYVPFISPYLFPAKQYNLLRLLNRLGLIRFYDDGIGAMSLQTVPWRKKYISCSQDQLISWDYRFLCAGKPKQNMVSILHAYEFFSQHLVDHPPPDGSANHGQPLHANDSWKGDLIISSKWVDWSSVLAMVGKENVSSATYLPHCVSHKNNQYLLENSVSWPYKIPPELVLPEVLNRYETVFFGVTSTIPFVIEVMLSLSLPVLPLFVLAIDYQQADSSGEAEDFTEKIRFYQQHHQLRLQVVGTPQEAML